VLTILTYKRGFSRDCSSQAILKGASWISHPYFSYSHRLTEKAASAIEGILRTVTDSIKV
jgi:hypothetical protein